MSAGVAEAVGGNGVAEREGEGDGDGERRRAPKGALVAPRYVAGEPPTEAPEWAPGNARWNCPNDVDVGGRGRVKGAVAPAAVFAS